MKSGAKARTRRNDSTATMSGHAGPDKPTAASVNRFRQLILGWYDVNRRTLPWRAPPGMRTDPYHVWLSEIMLQQTVVAAVIPYFLKFVKKWPYINGLANAPVEDVMDAWAGLGYYARARNLHKCAKVVAQERDGAFPADIEALKTLPGIGDYTSAAIASIAFDLPATVVDGNVERVMARYFAIETPLPAGKKDIRARAESLSSGRTDRPGDYAQALMDLGATVCVPKSPRCGLCPVRDGCAARAAGNAEGLPRRAVKKEKPRKTGHVYWIVNKRGEILMQRRPARDLLGGMPGCPTSDWAAGTGTDLPHLADIKHMIKKGKLEPQESVYHSFTHFDLELRGWTLCTSAIAPPAPGDYFWVEAKALKNLGIPTVFKKFVKLMLHHNMVE